MEEKAAFKNGLPEFAAKQLQADTGQFMLLKIQASDNDKLVISSEMLQIFFYSQTAPVSALPTILR